MAIPASIHNLLSGREVEWARIEFKTTWDPEDLLKRYALLQMTLITGVVGIS